MTHTQLCDWTITGFRQLTLTQSHQTGQSHHPRGEGFSPLGIAHLIWQQRPLWQLSTCRWQLHRLCSPTPQWLVVDCSVNIYVVVDCLSFWNFTREGCNTKLNRIDLNYGGNIRFHPCPLLSRTNHFATGFNFHKWRPNRMDERTCRECLSTCLKNNLIVLVHCEGIILLKNIY